ncbi:lipopolysaccharide kinase InaA family protein [Immundisolibacter sp.]
MTDRPDLPLRIAVPELGFLLCDRALRILPARRWTLAGTLEPAQRPVVAKLFLAGRQARRHFERERRGLEGLHRRGMAAPDVLYAGTLDELGGWLILTAWLPGASADTLGEAALPAVLRAVASHHAAGIEQRDAHLANFLVRSGIAWTLDGAGIRISGHPLPARRALRNLAAWLAQFPPAVDARLNEWCAVYGAIAGAIPRQELQCLLDRARRQREARHIDKALRSCTAFDARRTLRRLQVLDRRDDAPDLRAWLLAPDAPFENLQADWLKRGNSASVVRADLDGRLRVIKRYNLKNLAHRLRRLWRPSRAWHSWRNAQRLALWGLPTPRPVALLEHRFGWLRGRAWYVCEWVAGESLAQVLPAADPPRRDLLLDRLCGLLADLARLRLTHGDLKATNLLVDQDNQLMLLDLDALRRHRRRVTFERALARDLARLRANWADDAELLAALDAALTAAGLAR